MRKRFNHIVNFFVKNNKLHSFLFFLLISAILWFLSQFSDTYFYTFNLPVIYTDENSIDLPDFYQQDTLKVKIKSTGYGLLELKLKKPVFKYALNRIKTQDYWQPENYNTELKSLLGNDIKILEIKPKKIKLLKGINSKKVPVKALVKLNFAPSFLNKKLPEIEPKEVYIFGSPNLLETIDTIKTEKYTFDKVQADIDRQLDLDVPEKLIVTPNKIHFHLDVGQVISDKRKLRIFPISGNLDSEPLIFPSEVLVKYHFFRVDYPKIKNVIFKAGINQKKIKPGDSLIKVELIDKPQEIFDIELIPEYVKILIKK